jgi:hypothetical protein
MLTISVLLSLPFHFAAGQLAPAIRPLQIVTGIFSCAFGVYLADNVWINLL